MTETSPLATISRRIAKRADLEREEDELNNQAKAGQLMPGLELEIFDDQWKSPPHDGEAFGELLIKGPGSARRQPQPDKFNDGWSLGDVAKIDDEGYLIITDRSKDPTSPGASGSRRLI